MAINGRDWQCSAKHLKNLGSPVKATPILSKSNGIMSTNDADRCLISFSTVTFLKLRTLRQRRARDSRRERERCHLMGRNGMFMSGFHQLLSRSCKKHEATSYWSRWHMEGSMASRLSSQRLKLGIQKYSASYRLHVSWGAGQLRATYAMRSLLPISMGKVLASSRKRTKLRMHLSLRKRGRRLNSVQAAQPTELMRTQPKVWLWHCSLN